MTSRLPVHATGGAVAVTNEKGQLTMEKVHVARYVAGKRPDYAGGAGLSSGDDDTDSGDSAYERQMAAASRRTRPTPADSAIARNVVTTKDLLSDLESGEEEGSGDEEVVVTPDVTTNIAHDAADDDRLKRLQRTAAARRRSDRTREEESESDESLLSDDVRGGGEGMEDDDEGGSDAEERAAERRAAIRRKIMDKLRAEPSAAGGEQRHRDGAAESGAEDEDDSDALSDESDDEETDDDDDDDVRTRFKPVFVRKEDRVTLNANDEQRLAAVKVSAAGEETTQQTKQKRQRNARKFVDEYIKLERDQKVDRAADEKISQFARLSDVNTDDDEDDNDQNEDQTEADFVGAIDDEGNEHKKEGGGKRSSEDSYEQWKLRELRRIKRDHDARQAIINERKRIEAIHNMSEMERIRWARENTRLITNQKEKKARYKFLQKYYHRGAFYLDKEEDVLKRDTAPATLEDHFDKSVLPRVMQVKNFGKASRSKWTHLTKEDTTFVETNKHKQQQAAAAGQDSNMGQEKYRSSDYLIAARSGLLKSGGGMKQTFERPSAKRKT